jgi:acetyltransferase
VQLNRAIADAVRDAYRTVQEAVSERYSPDHFQGVTVQPMEKLEGYELIIGCSQDSQFGPVLLFGTGGTLVEVFRDRSLALPPLNTTLARRMMERTRIYEALGGVRGRKAVDLEALERLLVRFSQMVVEQPRIKEIDINPLFASPQRLVALDARVVLHDPELADDQLPRPAIRPYPERYVKPWQTRDGTQLVIRPIRPEDEPTMLEFHQTLSPHNLYLRYFHAISASQLIAHEQLTRMCFVDYDREITLVAEHQDSKGKRQIVALGQLTKLHGSSDAEFAVQVRDEFQGTGLGTEILTRLLAIGRDEKLERIVAEIMPENTGMRRICTKLGFEFHHIPDSRNIFAEVKL